MSTVHEPDSTSIRYTDTRSAYDAWSEVYDTDGNFLQALDTIEMKKLLPRMLSLIRTAKPWHIVDLGCGTGRNTTALVKLSDVKVTALDLSPKMLDIARSKIGEESQRLPRASVVQFEVFDMMASADVPEASRNADAIVSTLVVEHVSLAACFQIVSKMLKPEGLFLITNMHSDMGGISQAGFVDPKTGEKIRPTSYAHTVADTIEEARRQGFGVVGQIDEKSVNAELAAVLGARAKKWIGVTVWFGGIFRKIN